MNQIISFFIYFVAAGDVVVDFDSFAFSYEYRICPLSIVLTNRFEAFEYFLSLSFFFGWVFFATSKMHLMMISPLRMSFVEVG